MFDELTTIMNKLGLNLENMPEIKNKIKNHSKIEIKMNK